jgi:hypothetical protein
MAYIHVNTYVFVFTSSILFQIAQIIYQPDIICWNMYVNFNSNTEESINQYFCSRFVFWLNKGSSDWIIP